MDVMAPRVIALIGKRHVQSSGSFFFDLDSRPLFLECIEVALLPTPTRTVSVSVSVVMVVNHQRSMAFQYQFLC